MPVANSTDYAVILCYILLMAGVGLYVMRFNSTASEYFRGGSWIPWLVAGLSSFMSGVRAWTVTGGAGVAYSSGVAIIGRYIGNGLSFLLGYYIFAAQDLKSAILSKDIYESLFHPTAGERELLIIGALMTLLVGGATTILATMMATRGNSIVKVMLVFNTLISISYGPPAMLGLIFRRAPWWSGMLTFATGLTLGALGEFVFKWPFIVQIAFVVPSAFAVFFLCLLFDGQEKPGRAPLWFVPAGGRRARGTITMAESAL